MFYLRTILRCVAIPLWNYCRFSNSLQLCDRVVPSLHLTVGTASPRYFHISVGRYKRLGLFQTSILLYSRFLCRRWSCTLQKQGSLSHLEHSPTDRFKELSLEELFQKLSCQELYVEEPEVSIPSVTKQLFGRKAGSKWTSSGFLDVADDVNRWFDLNPRNSHSYATLLKILGLLGQTELVEFYMEEMKRQNIVITEEVVAAAASSFALCQQCDEVKKLLLVAKKEGIVPSESLISVTILSLMRSGYFEDAIQVLITGKLEDIEFDICRYLHENGEETNNCCSPVVDIRDCMQSQETFSDALGRIPDCYDIVTWTCLLKGLFDKGLYSFCLTAFEHLLSRGMEMDSVACDIAVQSCDKLRLISRAIKIHQLLKTNHPSILNSAIYSSLISCAASCADYRAAESFYEDAVSRKIALTYRAYFHLLRVYGRTGQHRKAIYVYHSLRFLPRKSLPSVHDWFLVFLSLRVAVQKTRNRYLCHPCTQFATDLENIRNEVNDIADQMLQHGRLLSKQAKHLYGVMERYLNIKMEVERWDDALRVLKDMSLDPNLPIHWRSTRFRLYVSWSRYLFAVSISEEQIWQTLETMKSCNIELNEPCVMAAVQGFVKMRQPTAALQLLQRPFLVIDQVERIHHLEEGDPIRWINSQRIVTLRKLYLFLKQHEPNLLNNFYSILEEKGFTSFLIET
ncbi:hypothetical protein GpartN1_g7544.t1 [Galdieria partita]|uniref:Uncharacterized protein n=1 Tax=Galdieria partita TaxID=83374 RepID=A0A9C7Q3E5_9RHOD|nr:hypothetical protein GpartN1_g7544.t1 [Galdieria partita]